MLLLSRPTAFSFRVGSAVDVRTFPVHALIVLGEEYVGYASFFQIWGSSSLAWLSAALPACSAAEGPRDDGNDLGCWVELWRLVGGRRRDEGGIVVMDGRWRALVSRVRTVRRVDIGEG